MFQFTRFASHTYVFSVRYLLLGGFPHSEVSGSKLICQLPEAYRRLSRPSSPIIAKASTTCSYSLDPITLTSPQGKTSPSASRNVCQVFHLTRLPYSTRFETLASKLNFCFDAIKMLLTARSAPHFHAARFPSATLISTL